MVNESPPLPDKTKTMTMCTSQIIYDGKNSK